MFIRAARRFLVSASLGIVLLWGMIGLGRSEEKQLGSADIVNEFNKSRKEREELMRGDRQPQGKEDKKLIETTARYLVYRVTWKAKNEANLKEMEGYHSQLWDFVKAVQGYGGKEGKNKAFIDQLGKPFADALKEVFVIDFKDNRAGVINAALMLPVIATLKQEPVGDLLADLLNGKEYHDAIKVYAAKAMGEFFPARLWKFQDDPKDPTLKKKLERDTARLDALVSYIKGKSTDTLDESERDVIRYLRREAIISLAKIGVPAIKSMSKEGKVYGPAAYELLRILIKGDGALDPPASLSERVEAAIGLCHLKYQLGDNDYINYDPNLAVYGVALCFLDFASEYSKDFANLNARKKNPGGTKEPTMAWKIQAERFKAALDDLATRNTQPGTKANDNAKALRDGAGPMADSILKTTQLPDLVPYMNKVVALAPASGKLYTVKGREVTEEHTRVEINPASLRGGPAAEGK